MACLLSGALFSRLEECGPSRPCQRAIGAWSGGWVGLRVVCSTADQVEAMQDQAPDAEVEGEASGALAVEESETVADETISLTNA